MGCSCNKSKKCEGPNCNTTNSPKILMNNSPDKPAPSQIQHVPLRSNIPSWDENAIPSWVTSSTPTQSPSFKDRIISPENTISKGLGMATSFITAIASKGLNSEKVNIPLKQLRVLSCFGNKDKGGQLPPCEYLKKSTTEGRFFCGGCGCGDKARTWLNSTDNEYSKLDYPKLACPLQMPGFTNYKESTPEESVSPITRRAYIEKMSYDHIKDINVSMPEPPATKQE